MNFKKILETGTNFIVKNRRTITTSLIIGAVTGTVLQAIKDTPRANLIVDEATTEKGSDLTKFETIKCYAKGYWKTIALFFLCLALIISSNVLEAKRFASVASCCAVAEESLKRYKDAAEEVLDKKKLEAVEKKVTEKKITKSQPENVIVTGTGDTLFFDEWNGRWFRSSVGAIDKAWAETVGELQSYDYVSVDDFYYRIFLPETKNGTILGWSTDRYKVIHLDHSRWAENEKGEPYCVLRFKEDPWFNFDK